jgi:endonuclease G, mitochondrial
VAKEPRSGTEHEVPRQINDNVLPEPPGDPILTAENWKAIADVMADPKNAWRAESQERKTAYATVHDITLPRHVEPADLDDALERAIGADDTVSTDWLRQGLRVAKTVALIRTARGPATGFLISDWLLLTNNHVLPTASVAEVSEALFGYTGREIDAIPVDFDPQRCFVTSPVDELDFTVVALRPLADGTAPGRRFGRVPMIGAIGKVMVGQPVNIVQHPGGGSRRVALRNNRVVSIDDERRLIYETDTQPGSSGSPVFNDRWQLVALHHRSEPARDADGAAIDINGQPVTPATPEHLRQWVANAGIRVSRLVTDLRARDFEPAVRELVDEALT